jgi:hypothetical protein
MGRATSNNRNDTVRRIVNRALELWEVELGRSASARKSFKTILASAIHNCVPLLQPETSEKSGNGNFKYFYGAALRRIKKQLGDDPTTTLPPADTAHHPPFTKTDFKCLAANDRGD